MSLDERIECIIPKKPGRKPKRKGYFYEEEEQAFKDFVNSESQAERDRIFRDKLYPAFTKMIESIIRRYKLFVLTEDFDDTFHDCMGFLITIVNNFDFSKGKKVYSYCGTCCKNYLIARCKKDVSQRGKYLSYDALFPTNDTDRRIEDEDVTRTTDFNESLIKNTIDEIRDIVEGDSVLTPVEIRIGYALIDLMENWTKIIDPKGTRKYNKEAVAYFIKEHASIDQKDLREGMRVYKKLYFIGRQKLVDE
ncbi:MAG: hypothetical protein LUD72_13715 [Bacteroidales bacterium]|nr:hypothetical protein [Bacteroidales bacterium]